jgi:hypothetical protein
MIFVDRVGERVDVEGITNDDFAYVISRSPRLLLAHRTLARKEEKDTHKEVEFKAKRYRNSLAPNDPASSSLTK